MVQGMHEGGVKMRIGQGRVCACGTCCEMLSRVAQSQPESCVGRARTCGAAEQLKVWRNGKICVSEQNAWQGRTMQSVAVFACEGNGLVGVSGGLQHIVNPHSQLSGEG